MSERKWALGILLGAFVLQGVVLESSGRWDAVDVPDTHLYVKFPFASLESTVSQTRTPGYPTLLAALRAVGISTDAVPIVHSVLFDGAVVIFYAGLVSIGCPRRQAAIIAGSLLASNIVLGYVQTIATETVAAAAGVATVGCLLRWHGGPQHPVRWGAALTVCTVIAWMTRPAYMFLVFFVSLVSLVLWTRSTDERPTLRQAATHLLLVGLMCGLPLLAWSSLRWTVMGKLGSVSFGGYNLIGVSGQFLDADVLLLLDEDLQPLAKAAMQRRSEIPVDELPMENFDRLNYMRMERQYDATIWRVFDPAAAEFYDEPPAINSALKDLGVALVKLRPRMYFVWLLKASRQALWKLIGDFVANPLGAVLICLTVLAAAIRLMRHWWTGTPVMWSGPMVETTAILFLSAALYAAMLTTVTILVCPPLGRMTDAAALLLFPLVTSVLLTLLSSRASKQEL